MKLATLRDGSRDGRLHVVSRDLTECLPAPSPFTTMQLALENWEEAEPALRAESGSLPSRRAARFDAMQAMAPLPRAWQWLDGSAFESHGELMERVFGIAVPDKSLPLMYQGVSDRFYAPTDGVPFVSEDDGIDFEGEFAVITDEVPMGCTAVQAAGHIRLVAQVNDWSLRLTAQREMKTGFGWVQGKPPCSAAPVAVTPDELGDAWQKTRVQLRLQVRWNAEQFGAAHGGAMAFGFDELVAHAAARRTLCAGTIIGSGTVSNPDYREVGSSCIAERRGIELLDFGAPRTAYMRFGDRVRMEAFAPDGGSVFGAIDQTVVKAPP